jgi:hypothetical protein
MIFSWKKPKGSEANLPFGLTEHQIELLSSLKENRAFDIYKKLLQDVAEYNGSYLLAEKEPNRMYYRQGFISALRDAIRIVDTITEEAHRARTARQSADARSLFDTRPFIGTAWLDRITDWNRSDTDPKPNS